MHYLRQNQDVPGFFTFADQLPHYLLDSVAMIDGFPQFYLQPMHLSIFVGQKLLALSNVAESKSTFV